MIDRKGIEFIANTINKIERDELHSFYDIVNEFAEAIEKENMGFGFDKKKFIDYSTR